MTLAQAVIETIEMLGAKAALSSLNVLILRREERLGGGKIHLRFASQRHIFAPLITILFSTFILAGCKPASDTLCGGDGFQPAEVICDLDAGEVTHAFLVIPEFISQ